MAEPAVSVVMGTYNHAPFVAEAIRSVLAQDFADFEFLIADDGSSDATPAIVAAQTDPRIRFEAHGCNQGAATVLNGLIRQAQGRYVAVLNSDDAWLPGKLGEQVAILDRSPGTGAVFGRAVFVDRDGGTINPGSLSFGRVFDQPNRSRGEWLRHFLWKGNGLCHPSVLIRRSVYDQVGLYDNRLRQLPDFDMWVRVVKATGIHVSRSPMVRFRILPGENTSSDTGANRIRTLNEHFFIAQDFFRNVPPAVLREGFADCLRQPRLPLEATARIEAAFLFLRPVISLEHVYRLVALMQLRELLRDEASRDLLARHYDFDDRSLHRLAAEADALHRLPPQAGIHLPASAGHMDRPAARDISQVATRELARIVWRRVRTRARLAMRSRRV